MTFRIQRLQSGDASLMNAMLSMFGQAFQDEQSYGSRRPSPRYLDELLAGPSFVALAAVTGEEVVGGIAAYELRKFEQERSELYIYDLAVAAAHRRQGIATALIRELGKIARERGAYVMFVQADLDDAPAIALYTKLGLREEALHFDISPEI
jgi:aminoglycoside 3-N-acetyltransferase I